MKKAKEDVNDKEAEPTKKSRNSSKSTPSKAAESRGKFLSRLRSARYIEKEVMMFRNCQRKGKAGG